MTIGVALASIGVAVDVALLIAAGAPPLAIAGTALGVVALAIAVAVVAAPAVAVSAFAMRRALGVARRRELPFPLVRFCGAAVAGAIPLWLVNDPFGHGIWGPYVVVVAVGAAGIGAAGYLLGARPLRSALVAAALFGIVAFAADIWLRRGLYPELHATAHIVGVAFTLAALGPLRVRLRRASSRQLATVVVGAVAAAVVASVAVDRALPGWRTSAIRYGRHGERLAIALRSSLDADRDGFSALAWGTDCDDFDAARHPFAIDEPGGGDANCNDVDPPAQPTVSQRGLAPERGAPHLPGGADLVVLLTIDSMRADALTPALTPALWALATRGAVFEGTYALGPGTRISLPLVFRPDDEAPPVTGFLAAHGVEVAAVVGGGVPPSTQGIPDGRWVGSDAESVTEAALERLRQRDGRPMLLWVHYFDPHQPIRVRDGEPPPPAPPMSLAYRSEVAYMDRHIGTLLEHLDFARTVVVVTADHGEAMGEHGVHGHMRSALDGVLRVPGVIVAPGVAPARSPKLASHRGLPATLLGAFGFEQAAKDAEQFGRSWLRVRGDADAPLHEFVVSRSFRSASGAIGSTPLGVLIDDRHKLVVGYEDGVFQLFDRIDDPGEDRDRAFADRDTVSRLWRKLALYGDIDGWPALADR